MDAYTEYTLAEHIQFTKVWLKHVELCYQHNVWDPDRLLDLRKRLVRRLSLLDQARLYSGPSKLVKIIDVIDPMEEMPTRKIINDLAAWDPKFTWIDSVLFYMIGDAPALPSRCVAAMHQKKKDH